LHKWQTEINLVSAPNLRAALMPHAVHRQIAAERLHLVIKLLLLRVVRNLPVLAEELELQIEIVAGHREIRLREAAESEAEPAPLPGVEITDHAGNRAGRLIRRQTHAPAARVPVRIAKEAILRRAAQLEASRAVAGPLLEVAI